MGQKVNPIGFRTGIMIGWKSRWYASKKEYADLLIEDHKIRKYVTDKYRFAGIPTIEIERTRDEVKVVLHAARPGVIIGRKGQQVDQLQDELQNLVGRRINIKIEEIQRPEIQAHLVAEEIADLQVFHEQVGELLLGGVPAAFPAHHDPSAETGRIDFLTHGILSSVRALSTDEALFQRVH